MSPDQSTLHVDDARQRLLAWEGCINARDLGGYRTVDGRQTRWGAIVRSDSPATLTPTGQDALRAYGIRTIVDLRLPSELRDNPNPFATPGDHGITYLHRSFIDGSDVNGPVATLADAYIGVFQRHAATIGRILSAIATAAEGGVLIHCHAGRDRTGTIAAFLLELAGVPRAIIGEDYALSTECLRSRDEHFLAHGPGDRADREREVDWAATRPEVILTALAWLDQAHGGVPAYLRRAGVTDHELNLLRDRLVDDARA
jgi:protein tyrosine/serine phosphatase